MSDPALDLLAHRAFPELTEAVRAVVSSTAAAWESTVRGTMPAADRLTMEQLRNDLPVTLRHVADALASANRFAVNVLVDVAPAHGSARYEQGYNLDELLIEYGVLRAILIQEIGSYLQRNLTTLEVVALSEALDMTVRRSVVRFVDHLSGQLRVSNEAKSKYLSFLSHDLRGGLNGVFLMIEVLKRELAGEERLAETVEDLDIMRRSLLDTVSTMDRFLHAERFRKGKIQVRPMPVNLQNALSETAAHFSYQARDKQVELRVDAPDDCTITTDRELLTLILQNLMSNALKFSKSKKSIVLAAQCKNDGWNMSIADQGPGIAPEKLDELFAPFTRGETHGQPGMGLGLFIARQAADYLQAKLWAESQPGNGSTFFVELPKELK